MRNISERSKIIYLLLLLVFIAGIFFFWLDYIGFVDVGRFFGLTKKEAPSVLDAKDDEPTLVEKEEFDKEKNRLSERVEDLDKREAKIVEAEKQIEAEKEKLEEMKKGLELEKKKHENEKNRYAGYMKNVLVLSKKIENIPPKEAVAIMVNWEDSLLIDVLRQIDANAEEAGKMSITSFLIQQMPREKASRIMYLMTQM
jgi:flagellar protein FlbB